MDKIMIIAAAVFCVGIFWIIVEAIQATRRWIKKEREDMFYDE